MARVLIQVAEVDLAVANFGVGKVLVLPFTAQQLASIRRRAGAWDLMAGLQRLFSTYGSLRRAWGDDSASCATGKDDFSDEFVRFVEAEILPTS